MRQPCLLIVSLLTTQFSACGGEDREGPPLGVTEFESAGSTYGPPGRDAYGGQDSEDGDERVVEEADIYRFDGDRLYVLNQYRGLYVFDVTDPDHPTELGRMPLTGYPVEMYVRDDRAFAVVSDDVGYRWAAAEEDAVVGLSPIFGSRIVGIDLSSPEEPVALGEVQLDGWVSTTRRVGDVIYAVANRWGGWGMDADAGASDAVEVASDRIVVTSIDVSQPSVMHAVELLELPGSGWYVHASPEAFIVASDRWDSPEGAQTEVSWIDISSPTGDMSLRGTTRLSGYLREDTAIDLCDDQLRILTRDWMTNLTKLRILDATKPEALPLLGELDYFYDGSLFGTTFDGDRLYMVHYMRIDPLEVVDLSDPTAPIVAGILEMPGWVDRIAAFGPRLVGLGIDDSSGTQRTSLSLFDVSDPSAPALLDRVTTGLDWSWSIASWERKAWTVDANEGLMLFPYSGWNEAEARPLHALGIVELHPLDLEPRGEVVAPAPVERAALYEDHVFAISQAALQVVDVTDRDDLVASATVELARNVLDYARTARAGAELLQPSLDLWWGYWGGERGSQLRITPLSGPDGPDELARLALPQAAQTLLAHDNLVVALRTWDSCADYWGWDEMGRGACGDNSRPGVMVVSLTTPTAPRVVADLPLPVPAPLPAGLRDQASQWSAWQTRYHEAAGGWQGGAPALDFGQGRYGLIRSTTTSCWTVEACRTLGIEPEPGNPGGVTPTPPEGPDPDGAEPGSREGEAGELGTWTWGWRTQAALAVLDLSDPADPRVFGPFELGTGVVEGAFAADGVLVTSTAVPSRVDDAGRSWVRYMMQRLRIGADGDVEAMPPINVPGVVVALRDGGTTALTLDQQWSGRDDWYGWGVEIWLNALHVVDDVAIRTAILRLGDDLGSLAVSGTRAYAVRSEIVERPDPQIDGWGRETMLTVIDVGDRDALEMGTDVDLGDGWWSIAAVGPSMLALSGGYSGGLALFDRSDPDQPVFERFVRTLGWTVSILQEADTLYIAGGPYGIQVIEGDGTFE